MLRYLSLFLCMAIVTLLTSECIRRWHVMPDRYRRVIPPLIAVFTVSAYGLGEAASQHAPMGFRVVAFTLAIAWLLLALVVNALQKPDASVYVDRVPR
jgi:hypothetical protein